MTLTEFISRYNGTYLEVAGSPGAENQCVDLANGYIRDVLNLPIIEWTNAKDFPSKADRDHYDWIPNTPDGVPTRGDIVVWGTKVGAAGHIAVYLEGNTMEFLSFDQNWPTGSPCHTQSHTYSGVLGWLHPKRGGGDSMVQLEASKFEELVGKSTKYDAFVAAGYSEPDAVKREVEGKQQTIDSLNQSVNDRNNDIARLNAEVSTLQTQLEAAEQKAESYKEQAVKFIDAQNQLTACQLEHEQLTESRAKAWEETDTLKRDMTKRLAERDKEIKQLTESAPLAFWQWLVTRWRR